MTVSEIVARPAEVVQRLFQQAGCPITYDAEWGVVDYFKEAIAAVGDDEIPRLNAQTVERLPHHSLVRFQAMVQDLINPEYYVGAFRRPSGEWVTTKFSDPDTSIIDLGNEDNSANPVVWERRPVVCVPIPGLSYWTLPNAGRTLDNPAFSNQDTTSEAAIGLELDQSLAQGQAANRPAKRERSSDADAQVSSDPERSAGAHWASPAAEPPLEQEDSTQDTELAGDQGPMPSAAVLGADATDEGVIRPRIRRREDRDVSGGGGAVPGVEGGTPAIPELAGRTRPVAQAEGDNARPHQVTSEEVPGSCIVYLYDGAPAVVLHEVVEIIGILSHMPHLAALEYENQDPLLEHDLASLEIGGGGAAVQADGRPVPGNQSGAADPYGEHLALEALRAAHPPTSKVMRLHAIIVRRNPPLVPDCREAPVATGAAESASNSGLLPLLTHPVVTSPRDRALGLLRWALGGDGLTAEYVLLQLVGRVATRGDPTALGQLTMNLCRCPASSPAAATTPAATGVAPHSAHPLAAGALRCSPGNLCAALHAAISSLVPLSTALPLSLESCNGVSWAPQRDHLRERTRPSPLQLAPGTVTLLDETQMAPGQLVPQGVASMQALAAVTRQQELMYDYGTFQHPVPVDLPIIILTEGRSLLRDSVHVRLPLSATRPFPTAAEVLAAASGSSPAWRLPAEGVERTDAAAGTPAGTAAEGGSTAAVSVSAAADDTPAAVWGAELAAVRCYLAAARATEGYGMAEGMPAVLEQYFVDARRQEAGGAGGGLTAEEFHTKLTLARLLVLSHGERQLTGERWQQLLQLEHTREARLRVMG